jgi:Flp pilus assembly pilin Flp
VALRKSIRRFLDDASGATAIEYALICGIMALAIISVAATGGAVDEIFETIMLVVDALVGANSG